MFCQKCGSPEQEADSYCKRCGEWLQGGRELAWYEFGKSSPEAGLKTVLGLNLVSAVLAFLCGVALLASLLTKTGVFFWGGLVSLYCVMLAGFQLWSYFVGRKLQKRLGRARGGSEREGGGAIEAGRAAAAAALGAADTSGFVGARSVSEHTTEILEALPSRRREGGETR